jgi:hypothetical protein
LCHYKNTKIKDLKFKRTVYAINAITKWDIDWIYINKLCKNLDKVGRLKKKQPLDKAKPR